MAANRWTINDDIPDKGDKYEWRLPNNDKEHMEQTIAPGDLLIKPQDMDVILTNSPKQEGLQHGADAWTFSNVPDTSWYVRGSVHD